MNAKADSPIGLDFQRIFETVPGCFMVLAPDGPRFTILAATDAYLRATKTQRATILGLGVFEVFPDNPDDPATKAVDSAGASFQRVVEHRRADVMGVRKLAIRRPASEGGGFEERFWDMVNFPVLGADGQVDCIIHRVEDVTESLQLKQKEVEQQAANIALRDSRRAALNLMKDAVAAREQVERASAALRVSEERYRALFDTMTEGFALHEIITDGDGRPVDYRFLEVNPAFERLTGLKAADLVGKRVREVIPTVEELWIENYGNVALTGEPLHAENYAAALGRWYRVFAYQIVPRQFAVIFSDITARKQAEVELRRSREDLDRAQAVGQIGSWRLDVRLNVLTWSGENHRIFGVPQGSPLTYETFLGIVHPDDRQYVDTQWRAAMAGEPYDIEHRIVADGQVKWVREKAYLEFDEAGKLLGGFGITQDITERKWAEARLSADLAALTQMHALSGRLLEAGGLQPLLQEIMDAAVAIMGAERGTLQLLESDSLRIVAHHGHQQSFLEFFTSAENRASVCGEALQRGNRAIVPDVEESSLFAGTPSLAVLREAGVRAVQSTPLVSRTGALLGILTTQWGGPYSPDEHDLWRIDLLARQAADLIESAEADEEVHRLLTTVREEKDRLTSLLNSISDEVWFADTNGRFTLANPSATREFRLESPDAIGVKNLAKSLEVYRGDGSPRPADEAPPLRALSGEVIRDEEEIVRTPDAGELRHRQVSSAPVRDAKGSIIGSVSVVRDITERKRIENALLFLIECGSAASGKDFFQALARYLAQNLEMDFVCIDRLLEDDLTAQTVAVYFDGKYEDNVAYALKDTPCGDVVGKTICCFPKDVRQLFPRDEVLQEMVAESYIGTTLWSSQGRPLGLIAVIGRQPLTNPKLAESILKLVSVRAAGELERRQAEEELRQANAQLAEADRRKDEFLAMLAHELRNPLAPVRNAIQIMNMIGPKDPVLQRNREMIERQVGHMARLLDDLLDVSRITRGKIALQVERLDLRTVVAQAVEIAEHGILGRRLEIDCVQPLGPVWIEGDYTRLEQIVGNLINNAIKYTDEGRIQVALITEPGPDGGQDWAVLCVRDTGIGIPAGMLPRVFDLFAQADQSLDRRRGGLGIGLTMVERLVQMHGGTVQACSAGTGKGSEFIVRLPLAEPTEAADGPQTPKPARETLGPGNGPRLALVVDDNEDTAQSMADIMRLWGYEVRTAHDGPTAVKRAMENPPDVILLDIGLPGMDGYEVARLLRGEAALDQIKIIALTGYGQDEARQRSKECGIDGHLVKPVNIAGLQALLRRMVIKG